MRAIWAARWAVVSMVARDRDEALVVWVVVVAASSARASVAPSTGVAGSSDVMAASRTGTVPVGAASVEAAFWAGSGVASAMAMWSPSAGCATF